jgi:hypothetical protein
MYTPYDDRKSEIPFASAEYISFASRNSFLGCPAVTMDKLGEGDVVIIGAPFDWGTTYRPGARFGPAAIRNADYGWVTGANKVWIAGPHAAGLPSAVLFPAVTKALELFRAGKVLKDGASLKRVVDLPVDLERFDEDERRAIDRFLEQAREQGAHLTYVARNRKAWWSVGLREPAPILATYMARRPPAFVLNRGQARHVNIAHGLYPREPLTDQRMSALIAYLSSAVKLNEGRTYAGGLTKFEPREMERLIVPGPDLLNPRGENGHA